MMERTAPALAMDPSQDSPGSAAMTSIIHRESGSEDVHYPVLYDGFPEEFKLLAEKVLKETGEKKLKGIQMLKDHIKQFVEKRRKCKSSKAFLEDEVGDLHEVVDTVNSENLHSIPDYLLEAVLRVSKYDMKKSKYKLEKCVNKQREIADMVVKTGLQKIEIVLDNFSCGILPYRDKSGNFILYSRPDGFNLDLHNVDDVTTACMVIILFILQCPITTFSGMTYFADCNLPSVTYLYPTVTGFRRMLQHPFSLPIRLSKTEILNPVPAAYWVYKLLHAVLPQKILKRVRFYPKGYDVLHEVYNKDILPEEFGGNAGPLYNSYFKEQLLEFAKEIIAEYA